MDHSLIRLHSLKMYETIIAVLVLYLLFVLLAENVIFKPKIINPLRMRRRVTVVCLCVCLSVTALAAPVLTSTVQPP